MQTQRAPRLQRTLRLAIAIALVLTGLCIYKYLVGVFEDHWVSIPSPLYLDGSSSSITMFLNLTRAQSKAPLLPTPYTG